MNQPPALNQMATPDGDHSELCGETCVASVLQAFGKNVTVEEVTTFIRNKYGEAGVSGGTNANELMDALANWNVAARIVNQPAATSNMGSNYAICAIWSDAGGNPDPSHFTGHWILGYNPTEFMNPYGGRYVTYPNLTGEDQNLALIIASPLPEDDMDLDTARSIVFTRLGASGLGVGSQAQVDAYAGPMSTPGANPEAKLTDLETDIGNNPNSLRNLVASLTSVVATLTAENAALAAEVAKIEAALKAASNSL